MAVEKKVGETTMQYVIRMHKENLVVAIIADVVLVGGIGWLVVAGVKFVKSKFGKKR